MLQGYKSKTNLFTILGLIVLWVGPVFGHVIGQDLGIQGLGIIIGQAGAVLLIIGCYYLAKGKGYHGAWGLLGIPSLLGFLPGLIGLIVLTCMRDKYKAQATLAKKESTM